MGGAQVGFEAIELIDSIPKRPLNYESAHKLELTVPINRRKGTDIKETTSRGIGEPVTSRGPRDNRRFGDDDNHESDLTCTE